MPVMAGRRLICWWLILGYSGVGDPSLYTCMEQHMYTGVISVARRLYRRDRASSHKMVLESMRKEGGVPTGAVNGSGGEQTRQFLRKSLRHLPRKMARTLNVCSHAPRTAAWVRQLLRESSRELTRESLHTTLRESLLPPPVNSLLVADVCVL